MSSAKDEAMVVVTLVAQKNLVMSINPRWAAIGSGELPQNLIFVVCGAQNQPIAPRHSSPKPSGGVPGLMLYW
jgi:hypothetical protein